MLKNPYERNYTESCSWDAEADRQKTPNLYTRLQSPLVDGPHHLVVTTGYVTNIVTYVTHPRSDHCVWSYHPKHCSGCWMVRPDTVVTGRMGKICYHVTNIPQWRLVDVGHHTPVVTGVCCIDWVIIHGYVCYCLSVALSSEKVQVRR